MLYIFLSFLAHRGRFVPGLGQEGPPEDHLELVVVEEVHVFREAVARREALRHGDLGVDDGGGGDGHVLVGHVVVSEADAEEGGFSEFIQCIYSFVLMINYISWHNLSFSL